MKKYINVIKDNDMFGHTINLNYNRNGDSQKTFIGGLFSMLIKVTFAFYLYTLFDRMFMNKGDSNYTRINVMNLTDVG